LQTQSKISLRGRVREWGTGISGGCDLVLVLFLLFLGVSSLKVFKLQQSYLEDHGGVAFSSVFWAKGKVSETAYCH
jgi:hypothetical protein